MAEKKPAAPKTEKAKRTVLTAAERIAKIEAELAAAKAKAAEAGAKKSAVLLEQRDKLIAKINELKTKVVDIEAELKSFGWNGDEDVKSEAPATEGVEV
jgi:chromosome segregation ATPase